MSAVLAVGTFLLGVVIVVWSTERLPDGSYPTQTAAPGLDARLIALPRQPPADRHGGARGT
jgi:hypothetical protein